MPSCVAYWTVIGFADDLDNVTRKAADVPSLTSAASAIEIVGLLVTSTVTVAVLSLPQVSITAYVNSSVPLNPLAGE